VRAQTRKAYARNLCLAQGIRVQYVQLCLMAKIWYASHIFPSLKTHTQQLKRVGTWFIWQGDTFRVPVTTLKRPKKQGCWALLGIPAKCRTLLLSRKWMLSARERSVTVAWVHKWKLIGTLANPPHGNRIPTKMACIRYYAIDVAYVTPPSNTVTENLQETTVRNATINGPRW